MVTIFSTNIFGGGKWEAVILLVVSIHLGDLLGERRGR